MAKQIALGFHSCEISVFDNATGDAPKTPTSESDIIKIDNKDSNGAAQELKLDGLGGETKKQYGNDGVAFVGTKSLGDVKATLTALGMTLDQKAKLTGAKNDEGFYFFAPDNTVPSCSMLVTSKTEDGKYLCIGLLKCKASLGDINLSTLDDGAPEPKGEEMTLEAGSDGREGHETDVVVQVVLDADGTDKEKFKKFRQWVLRLEDAKTLPTNSQK